MQKQAGFSLLEVLIASAVVSAGLMMAVISMWHCHQQVAHLQIAQYDAQRAVNQRESQ